MSSANNPASEFKFSHNILVFLCYTHTEIHDNTCLVQIALLLWTLYLVIKQDNRTEKPLGLNCTLLSCTVNSPGLINSPHVFFHVILCVSLTWPAVIRAWECFLLKRNSVNPKRLHRHDYFSLSQCCCWEWGLNNAAWVRTAYCVAPAGGKFSGTCMEVCFELFFWAAKLDLMMLSVLWASFKLMHLLCWSYF